MLSCNQKPKKYINKKYLPHNKFFYLFQIIGSASNFTNVERSETLFEIVKWAERRFDWKSSGFSRVGYFCRWLTKVTRRRQKKCIKNFSVLKASPSPIKTGHSKKENSNIIVKKLFYKILLQNKNLFLNYTL